MLRSANNLLVSAKVGVMVAAVMLFSVICSADAQETASSDRRVQLSVAFHKDKISLGEPLLLESTIENSSDDIVAFDESGLTAYPSATQNPVNLYVGRKKDSLEEWSHSLGAGIFGPYERLSPNERWTGVNIVLGRVAPGKKRVSARMTFNKPGEYFVRVRCYKVRTQPLRSTDKYIASSAKKLLVSKPQGRANREAWEDIARHKRAYITVLQAPRWVREEKSPPPLHPIFLPSGSIDWYEEFVEEHRDSIYVQYVSCSLGVLYQSRANRHRSNGRNDRYKMAMRKAKKYFGIAEAQADNDLVRRIANESKKTNR